MRFFWCISVLFFVSVNSSNVVKVPPKDLPNSPQKFARIVNGEAAERSQFPFQVSIRAFSNKSVSVCGGSVISPEYILTAAHCTKGYNKFEIGFGSNVLNSPLFRVVSFRKVEHAGFDPKVLTHDIAVIKLPVKLPFSKNVQAVKLPKKAPNKTAYFGEKVTVSGFGRTSDESKHISQNLNFVDLKVISNSDCADIFGSKIVTNNVICARGIVRNHQNTGACMGDSGGPMILEKDGKMVQIGIVSFVSSRGCSFGDPSGYTNVAKYLDWITNMTGIKSFQ